MASISACMIVKDESKVIWRTLKDLLYVFDEIIIVDTGSTDETKDIIQSFNDERIRLYEFRWCNDFAAARNYSYQFATSDFVTWWDADDKMSIGFTSMVNLYIKSGMYDIDQINNCTILQRDKYGIATNWIENERIVRRSKFKYWKYRIHEKPIYDPVDPDRQVSFDQNHDCHVEVFRKLNDDSHLSKYIQLINEGNSFCLHDYYWMLIMMDQVCDFSYLDWWKSNYKFASSVLEEERGYMDLIDRYIRYQCSPQLKSIY